MERGWKRHQRLWLFSGVLVFGVGLTVLPAAADGVDTAPPATTADAVSTPISRLRLLIRLHIMFQLREQR